MRFGYYRKTPPHTQDIEPTRYSFPYMLAHYHIIFYVNLPSFSSCLRFARFRLAAPPADSGGLPRSKQASKQEISSCGHRQVTFPGDLDIMIAHIINNTRFFFLEDCIII